VRSPEVKDVVLLVNGKGEADEEPSLCARAGATAMTKAKPASATAARR